MVLWTPFGLRTLLRWTTPLYKVVFDERFPSSVAFGDEWASHGIQTHAINGDVTALWYHDLYFRWKKGPAAIAGMTTRESLFCLDLLARDAGLRLIGRQERGDGLVAWTIGPRRAPISLI
jgi:hypothetical protein